MNKQTSGTHGDEDESGPASRNKDENLVFEQDKLWYFRNSEGDQIGPFRYAQEAQSNLDLVLQSIQDSLKVDLDKKQR